MLLNYIPMKIFVITCQIDVYILSLEMQRKSNQNQHEKNIRALKSKLSIYTYQKIITGIMRNFIMTGELIFPVPRSQGGEFILPCQLHPY